MGSFFYLFPGLIHHGKGGDSLFRMKEHRFLALVALDMGIRSHGDILDDGVIEAVFFK